MFAGYVRSSSGSITPPSIDSGATASTVGSHPSARKCGSASRTRCMSGALTGGKCGETMRTFFMPGRKRHAVVSGFRLQHLAHVVALARPHDLIGAPDVFADQADAH